MAVTLLYRPTTTSIGTLKLDAALTETHTADVDVTDHPVEQGADISDHRRPKPRTLTIEGFVTNTPMPAETAESVQRGLVRNGQTVGTFQSRSTLEPTRSGEAYETLLSFREGDLLTVVTTMETLEDMAITALSVPRDAKTGQALRFSVTLKQVIIVSSKRVKVAPRHAPKKNLGKVATTKAAPATKAKSLLFDAEHSETAKKVLNFFRGQ